MTLETGASPPALRIPERGHTDVPSEFWRQLASDRGTWELIERNRLRVSHIGSGRTRLHGTSYVGRAVLAGRRVDFIEKVDGALAATFRYASREAFRVDRAASPGTDLDDLFVLLVDQFLTSAEVYASSGREFRYSRQERGGSLVGGRLLVSRTGALWAKGFRHMAVFERDEISYDIEINQLIYAAIREIDSPAIQPVLPTGMLARARTLALLFEDCLEEVLRLPRSHFMDLSERLHGASDSQHSDLTALAGLVLSHESFGDGVPVAKVLPRSWFINLETLFEKAVRTVLQVGRPAGWAVEAGSSRKAYVFEGDRRWNADPDIVIQPAAGAPVVGDVKYKEWSGTPSHSDVYQLLVHAAAYDASMCFLLYPHHNYFAHRVGDAVTGASMWIFGVDVRELDAHLVGVLGEVERLKHPKAAPAHGPVGVQTLSAAHG